jgi:Helicase conserved C-terminal domain
VVRARNLAGQPPAPARFGGGTPLPGYAAALSALPDADLVRLLERRPDLLAGPAPASFPELAGRAGSPASLAAALRTLDLGALRLAELLAVVGLPTTVDALGEAAGPGLEARRLLAGLGALAELGIALPGRDGVIAGPPRLAAPFGRPGGLGPPVAELAKVGVSAEQLQRVLANLGVPPPPAGGEAPGGGMAEREPASGAGRTAGKAALVRAVSAALADPRVVARALEPAGADVRRLLDEAVAAPGPITVMGVGYGRFAGYPDAEPASWLLARGLLLPVTYNQFVVPREAALGLRGGLVFPDWPAPPVAEPLDPLPDGLALAAAAATRAVVAAEGICTRLDREPLVLVRAGTVAVRDLRRLAGELDLADDELALLVDLLVEAGVLAVGGPFGQRSLGLRPEADAWLAGSRARRWADLAVAWRAADLALEDHLAARRAPGGSGGPPGGVRGTPPGFPGGSGGPPVGRAPEGADRPRPLAGRRLAAAAARRRGLMEALAVWHPRAVAPDDLAALLAWRQPLMWPTPPRSERPGPRVAVRAVLDAAGFLGLTAAGDRRAQAGLAAEAWVAGADAALLATAAAPLLPDGTDRFLVAGDLTVVAARGLAPSVEARLAALADRETAGGTATWRIHEASLRRAFDEGRSAEEVVDFLRAHSDTPLPQALEYLVADAARRHGRLRVGGAATYLRGDPALVAGAVRSTAGRRLGLRELAPGVAVTARPQRELLAALRKAGEAPLAEEPDGRPRPETPRPVRHTPRAAVDSSGSRSASLGGAASASNGHPQARLAERQPAELADGEQHRPAELEPRADPAAAVARLRGPTDRRTPREPAEREPPDPAAEETVRG